MSFPLDIPVDTSKNKTYIHLSGGLGNMLFQIAAAYAYSLRHNKTLELNDTFYSASSHHPLHFYKKNILSKLDVKNEPGPDFFDSEIRLYREPRFSFNEIPKQPCSNLLRGCYQSFKYFSDFEEEVKNLFTLKNSSEYDGFLENSCSIHIRLGDYLTPKHRSLYPRQPLKYFERAVKTVGTDKTFLIFSDQIELAKKALALESLNLKRIVYIENQNPYEDLSLMSRCENNIMTNSTFSWWGAFLNRHAKKIVICPGDWFSKLHALQIGAEQTPKDLFPRDWLIVNKTRAIPL